MDTRLASFSADGLAVVIGATGGLGGALVTAIADTGRFTAVIGLSRRTTPSLELTDEGSIADAAAAVAVHGLPVRLVIVATGLLHDAGMGPEKSWRQLDASNLARGFAINATGPALVAKHFLPLLPRSGKAVFAALSAKVGSIGDNHLGGWYGYRAAKAALNQLVHTAAIELRRTRPDAICVTLHPGTVATGLSEPFRGPGHEGDAPEFSAARLLSVIDALTPQATGQFIDHSGIALPW